MRNAPPSIQNATFETYKIPVESIWMDKPIVEKTVEKAVEKTVKEGDSRKGSRILT
jgi:hypothetical protein